jgi:hypothetical protein
MKKFNLKNLTEVEVRKLYLIQISNRCSALENLNDSDDINRAWEKKLKRISKSQLKRHHVCTNGSSVNHDLMKSVYSS